MASLWARGKIGKVAVPALIEALNDEDQIIRNNSASALGYKDKVRKP